LKKPLPDRILASGMETSVSFGSLDV